MSRVREGKWSDIKGSNLEGGERERERERKVICFMRCMQVGGGKKDEERKDKGRKGRK